MFTKIVEIFFVFLVAQILEFVTTAGIQTLTLKWNILVDSFAMQDKASLVSLKFTIVFTQYFEIGILNPLFKLESTKFTFLLLIY